MGHRRLKSRASEWYERYDPDFLEDARKLTDAFMARQSASDPVNPC